MRIQTNYHSMSRGGRILLTTVFSAFNYGSSLQALAGKRIIEKTGYECELVKLKSLVKGRDVRIGKLTTILFRSVFLKKNNTLKTYKTSYKKALVEGTGRKFFDFNDTYLKPIEVTNRELKRMAEKSVACFSGSDQIWNSSTLYVDPLYYLRFAPKYKRVALSPSFGRDFIADYNKEKMKKWISDYPYLSVREDSGVRLIKELTGKDAMHLLDPTLIIRSDEWRSILCIEKKPSDYILAYFLDEPSDYAKKSLKELKEKLGCKILAIPYKFERMDYSDGVVAAGPKEFVELVANAKVVCTDSFHGTVFAMNMHTPFFTFEREYGSANKQSERVLSILRKVGMLDRYQPKNVVAELNNLDFEHSEEVLDAERKKAYDYVNNAISSIRKNEM